MRSSEPSGEGEPLPEHLRLPNAKERLRLIESGGVVPDTFAIAAARREFLRTLRVKPADVRQWEWDSARR